jgi:hypothetical protein
VLGLLRCRFRAFDHDARQGFGDQFHIMSIGSCHYQTDGNSLSLRQQTALDSCLAAVGGIGADFFPRPVALWSSHHLDLATPSRYPSTHQTVRRLLAIVLRRHRRLPIPESGHALWTWRIIRSHLTLPTVSLSAVHRKSHPHTCGLAPEDAHPQTDADSHAPAPRALALPTTHPKLDSRSSSDCLLFFVVFVALYSLFSSPYFTIRLFG